jgi:hypothetical protein
MVREAMKKRASHWGAARQEDAHEVLLQLLQNQRASQDFLESAFCGSGSGGSIMRAVSAAHA